MQQVGGNNRHGAWLIRYTTMAALMTCLQAGMPQARLPPIPRQVMDVVRGGDVAKVKEILSSGAPINARERGTQQTMLMAATLAGQAEVVRLLLQNGADWKVAEQDGYTPMHGAAFQGRKDVAEVLLEFGVPADGGEPHKDGYPPIFRAVWGTEQRHLEFLRFMIDEGHVDINVEDSQGLTLLDHAMQRQRIPAAKYLRLTGIRTTAEQRHKLKGKKVEL